MKKNQSKVSIVIPTRNRLGSLTRTLASISKQTYLPSEVIIVDSSDSELIKEQLNAFLNLNLKILYSKPSVCLQRNIGIEWCDTEYIFLCDDDIEISENYIENLVNYLNENNSVVIVSGLVYEKRKQKWQYAEKKKSFLKLLYTYIFGLSVWTEIKQEDYSKNKLIQKFVSYFINKGNRIAKSGWPIVINYEAPCFKTPIYSLMASLVRAESIKKVLFDTAFYENGIGDNYDMLIGLNTNVDILKYQKVFHHEENTNRINNIQAYHYRISALHYIILKHKKFNLKNLIYLFWSLIGNSILFLIKGNLKLFVYNLRVIINIIFNQNIYSLEN
ncbi:hypothetical protein BFR04_00630 [Gaetbulibacter sp. 4G1]|nr:glycosyltransferase family 2 protein [Gaetbulibacter sp. 4G1]PIA79391.1 hypothetical protein BFR04_00630 [Gaetbulibacter sp. 4G1]